MQNRSFGSRVASGLKSTQNNKPDHHLAMSSLFDSGSENSVQEMEDIDLVPEEELEDCTQYRGKPYKDLTLEDLKDVEFKTIDDVDRFYSFYAQAKGFTMRKNKLDKNRSGTAVIRRELVCSKQGLRKEYVPPKDSTSQQQSMVKHDTPSWNSNLKNCQKYGNGEKDVIEQNPQKKQCRKVRRTTRENCPANILVKLCPKRGIYYVSEFITEHNHVLAKSAHRQFIKSHWTVREPDLAQIKQLGNVAVATCHVYEFLVHPAGGYKFVGLTLRELYKGERKQIMLDGDAQSLVTWMNLKAMWDPHFYCIFTVNEEGKLANMFWRDGQSLIDYNDFGEVLVFKTFQSNIQGKPLAVFVGSNNHRATILFGCALLVDETEETYNWVITSFLASMQGKKAISVITDGDDAVCNAVNNLIPEARQRLCAWHIGKIVCLHLKDVDAQRDFFHLIFAGLQVEEWQTAWQHFVVMNCLENDMWATSMYNKREKWAEAYFRDQFFGGICSTQRCQGMHRNLKTGIGRHMRMYEVLPRMEKTIEGIRNRVLQEEYRSEHFNPVYESHMPCLEEDISKKFSHDIFLMIRDQINFESKFVIVRSDVEPNSSASLITLMQYGKPERSWTVWYQPDGDNPRFICSCKLFESDGIPCCHIFAVMKSVMLTTFPESLVNKRWAKDVMARRTSSPSSIATDKSVQITRYSELMAQCAKICHIASCSEEGYDEIREALSQLTIQSEKCKAASSDTLVVGHSDYGTSNSSEGEFEDSVINRRQTMNLNHHLEEARTFEFFTGYNKSQIAASKSTSTGRPDFFQHFRPFPNA